MAVWGADMATADHCRCHACIVEIVVRHANAIIPVGDPRERAGAGNEGGSIMQCISDLLCLEHRIAIAGVLTMGTRRSVPGFSR